MAGLSANDDFVALSQPSLRELNSPDFLPGLLPSPKTESRHGDIRCNAILAQPDVRNTQPLSNRSHWLVPNEIIEFRSNGRKEECGPRALWG